MRSAIVGLMTTDPAPLLDARNVLKRYGDVTALAGVTLSVAAGECVALVGASGSGKTTLLRTFNGLVIPEQGIVRVHGTDVAQQDLTQLRRRLGYVPQNGGLLPHWTVHRNVRLVPDLRGLPDGDDRVRRVLGLVGLPAEEYGSRWPRELSGGERQRVAIARALAADPDVILLDEPFGALDAITRSEVQDAFSELRRSLGVTTVLVTHDLREALKLATRICVLHEGSVDRIATPAELHNDPGTGYTRTLFAGAGLVGRS